MSTSSAPTIEMASKRRGRLSRRPRSGRAETFRKACLCRDLNSTFTYGNGTVESITSYDFGLIHSKIIVIQAKRDGVDGGELRAGPVQRRGYRV